MRDTFVAFYRPNPDQIERAWVEATFVLDTNILLNLYRYPLSARTELLEVLKALQARIWIPYHVGMEFQRNRLTVIASQQKRFTELKVEIENVGTTLRKGIAKLQLKKRHALIDVDPILSQMDASVQGFVKILDDLRQKDDLSFDADPIRDQLDEILRGRVGAAPSKEEVSALNVEGEKRFKHQMPPGYADAEKDKRPGANYMFQGIPYETRFGDFFVWRQTVEHAKKNEIKALIFLTDDEKEDWWQVVDVDGPKKIGARPELRDEIMREGGVEFFHMYNSESFLIHAKKYLLPTVQQESIEEVAEVLEEHRELGARFRAHIGSDVGLCVVQWLEQLEASVYESSGATYVYFGESTLSLTVQVTHDGSRLEKTIIEMLEEAESAGPYAKKHLIVIVAVDGATVDAARMWFGQGRNDFLPSGFTILFGHLRRHRSNINRAAFYPIFSVGEQASDFMARSSWQSPRI